MHHDRESDLAARERHLRKAQRVGVLSELLEMHSQSDNPDLNYIAGLRKRLNKARNEARCMNGE